MELNVGSVTEAVSLHLLRRINVTANTQLHHGQEKAIFASLTTSCSLQARLLAALCCHPSVCPGLRQRMGSSAPRSDTPMRCPSVFASPANLCRHGRPRRKSLQQAGQDAAGGVLRSPAS